MVGYAHTWGEHRVFYRKPDDQRVYSIPSGWTDVESIDPVVVLAKGRSLFRATDLVALAQLLGEMKGGSVR